MIVDHVDRMVRVYLEGDGVPEFKFAVFTGTVFDVVATPDGYHIRVTSAVVGQPIPDQPEDHVASNWQGTMTASPRSHATAATGRHYISTNR